MNVDPGAHVLHRPLGGHPYRVEPDQRHPVHPSGDSVQLRVLARSDVSAINVELDRDVLSTRALERADVEALYSAGSATDGHLMEVSRALPDLFGRTMWIATVDLAPLGGDPASFAYRFVSRGPSDDDAEETTMWFHCSSVRWQPTGGQLRVVGDDSRLISTRTNWLCGADGPVAVRLVLALDAAEHVVGFGERFDRLDQRGQILDTTVFEQYQQQGARTYMPSPFGIVAGGDGWGFHVRTSRRTWFDIGATDSNAIVVEAAVDPGHPELDVRVYEGGPGDVLSSHLSEIGGAAIPPSWVFRPWMSANDWDTQLKVVEQVQRSLDLDVPVGVVVIEAWSDESTFVVFRDAEYTVRDDGSPLQLADITHPADGAWPNPKGMVDWLHANGVKVLLWQIPLIPIDRGDAGQVAADARTMIERRYCVLDGNGDPYHNRGWWFTGALLPDWSNDEARAWWLAKRRYLLTDVGIDGFKTDGGEHAWGDDLRYADGSRGDESNNLYALRYSQAYHELIDGAGGDATTFSRAGFTGAATAPCHWAGDESSTWEAFRASVTAGLSAAASGVLFWGWDLAGFSGDIPTVELYVRAAAMAALCPIMQYHSEFNHRRVPTQDRTPWNVAELRGDERALSLYRHYAKLRGRLLPYIAEQAAACVATGTPLMRPLCFDHPADPAVWQYPYQYHFGDDLLVAPIVHPDTDVVDVYLPAGRWSDAWTGSVHVGPVVVSRRTPLDEIAVYIRGDDATLQQAFAVDLTSR